MYSSRDSSDARLKTIIVGTVITTITSLSISIISFVCLRALLFFQVDSIQMLQLSLEHHFFSLLLLKSCNLTSFPKG